MTDDRENDRFSTGAGLDLLSRVAGSGSEALIGRELGGYRITALIAEGGMSRVYRAERTDGSFDRDVAIKISPASGLSREFRERFLREQGMLAGLNHPNICQLYDAQVTEEGWPYIVMELIDGAPVDEWCRERAKDRAAVVRLMIGIADALAYAHARLIVHRDIKPSNVLVNAEGRPKLLDFGIAKLLEPDVTALTRVSPMTPRYASPEQLLGDEVTIGSDIYQLGLLFCEMLTGERLNLDQSLSAAIRRAADRRGISLPAGVRTRLPRELLLIIEQCLRVSPDDRYTYANALKRDLEAWLAGYPVTAAGQGAAYRFGKLLVRNRAATLITVVSAAAIIGFSLWYTYSLAEARRIAEAERDNAQHQSRMANESLDFLAEILRAANPNVSQNREATVLEVLQAGATRIDTELDDQPEIQARLYSELWLIYNSLAQYEQAESAAEKAFELNSSIHGPDSEQAIRGLIALGQASSSLTHYDRAESRMRRALDRAIDVLGPEHPAVFEATNALASLYWILGDTGKFATLTETNYFAALEALGQSDAGTLNYAHSYAITLVEAGKLDQAGEIARDSIVHSENALGDAHETTLSLMSILATVYGYTGELQRERDLRQSIIEREMFAVGEDHPRVADAKANLAYVYFDLGEPGKIRELLEDAIAIWSETSGPESPVALRGRANLAYFMARLEASEEARDDLVAVHEIRKRVLGEDHPNTVESQMQIAELFLRDGAPDAKERVAEAEERARSVLGAESPVLAHFLGQIAEISQSRGSLR